MPIQVDIVADVSPDLVDALNRLLAQLSSSPKTLTQTNLEAVVGSSSAVLLIARSNQDVAGMLTLGWFSSPTGRKAFIDDVVVDERFRGQGIGEILVRSALDHAHRQGAGTVDLTSRPAREAANRLYQRIGFQKRETNAYRYRFDEISG